MGTMDGTAASKKVLESAILAAGTLRTETSRFRFGK